MIAIYLPMEALDVSRQPHAEPLDLTRSDETLLQQVGLPPAANAF
ncbi:MAG TPA: hypothetical protein VLM91_17355 [Candidatus Methylomirabilis sp.]|nr:hypothetical protein [Candidatus Methylomirabilis sp.]